MVCAAMTNLSVIILVGKEERYIADCLEKLALLDPRQIFNVESQKGDRIHEITIETARQLGWQLIENVESFSVIPSSSTCNRYLPWHDWIGLYANQFNLAFDNPPLEGEWILRLDVDEYLAEETIERLKSAHGLRAMPDSVAGITLELKRRFCGGAKTEAKNVQGIQVRQGAVRSNARIHRENPFTAVP